MITGQKYIQCTLYMYMFLSEEIKKNTSSCIDNLQSGLAYLTNLTHELRVDTQYLYK